MVFTNKQAVFLLWLCVTALSSCSVEQASEVGVSEQLDAAAVSYVKLGLELGVYDKDYVDAYLGPEDWAIAAKDSPRSRLLLAEDIAQLLQQLQRMTIAETPLLIRHKALYRNVRAMDARARMLNGEQFSFAEEARLIYDVAVPDYDFSEFDDVLKQIEELIPGEGELAERVERFTAAFSIQDDKVSEVVDMAIAECRKRSARYIELPENERFTLEYVTDKNWTGYNWYQGDNYSLMQINRDHAMQIDRAIGLGCHEGYPGHHVWNVLVENNLLNKNGWIEFSLFPLFSPYALIAEGSANYGVELSFPGEQKMAYERDFLYPITGLDPETAKTYDQLSRLLSKLSIAATAITKRYLDGEISREDAITMRRKYSMVSRERAEQGIRFGEQYRAYVLNYTLGKDIVAQYITGQSDTEDGRWAAFETMLTDLLTASDMQNQ